MAHAAPKGRFQSEPCLSMHILSNNHPLRQTSDKAIVKLLGNSIAAVAQRREEVTKALNPAIREAIVDIKASTDNTESELSRNGYTRLQDKQGTKKGKRHDDTFDNKVSLWTWKREQGTCSGRLRPIIDIQLVAEVSFLVALAPSLLLLSLSVGVVCVCPSLSLSLSLK